MSMPAPVDPEEWARRMRARGQRVRVDVRTPSGLAIDTMRRMVTTSQAELARALGLPADLVQVEVRGAGRRAR